MKKTKQQEHLEFLKAHGWAENPNARTSKYVEMVKVGVNYKYYLGRAGAVRRGTTVSNSYSVKLKLDQAMPKAKPTVTMPPEYVDGTPECNARIKAYEDADEEGEQRPDPSSLIRQFVRESDAWAGANLGAVMRAEREERERQLVAGEI